MKQKIRRLRSRQVRRRPDLEDERLRWQLTVQDLAFIKQRQTTITSLAIAAYVGVSALDSACVCVRAVAVILVAILSVIVLCLLYGGERSARREKNAARSRLGFDGGEGGDAAAARWFFVAHLVVVIGGMALVVADIIPRPIPHPTPWLW